MADLSTPSCRYCSSPVIRGVPCSCARAQEEARRIAGGHDGGAIRLRDESLAIEERREG